MSNNSQVFLLYFVCEEFDTFQRAARPTGTGLLSTEGGALRFTEPKGQAHIKEHWRVWSWQVRCAVLSNTLILQPLKMHLYSILKSGKHWNTQQKDKITLGQSILKMLSSASIWNRNWNAANVVFSVKAMVITKVLQWCVWLGIPFAKLTAQTGNFMVAIAKDCHCFANISWVTIKGPILRTQEEGWYQLLPSWGQSQP